LKVAIWIRLVLAPVGVLIAARAARTLYPSGISIIGLLVGTSMLGITKDTLFCESHS